MILTLAVALQGFVGWQGRTRVPRVDTPSLKSGAVVQLVSSHCEPPSSEKNENGCDGDRRGRPPRPGGPIMACPLLYLRGFLPTGCHGNKAEPGFEAADHQEKASNGLGGFFGGPR